MNKMFKQELYEIGWEESRVSYWVTKDEKLIRRTIALPPELQKKEIEREKEEAICNYN